MAIAFGLFAFTTLLCDLTYAEIAANKISTSKGFIGFVRVLGALFFVPLGTITVLAGLQLDNLWYVSDLINVVLVLINIPTCSWPGISSSMHIRIINAAKAGGLCHPT